MSRMLSVLLLAAGSLAAEEIALRIDPAKTSVQFKLGATLHSVRGTFQVKRGEIRFDEATGAASGEVVIDAASGQSGNSDRDRDMHSKVLESARFPEIIFRPNRVAGSIAAQGVTRVTTTGVVSIHGADHEIAVPLQVEISGGQYTASGSFSVPYVKWGMKNPSKTLLRVSENVEITIRGVAGRIR
jgi:polyisoprenoid-binding protein YceI